MESSSPEAASYDNWAEVYDLGDADRAPFIAFYTSLLRPGMDSVLELGCGTGTITSVVARELRSLVGAGSVRVIGVDGSTGMLKVARERDQSIEWLLGDLRSPLVTGRFDLVYCCFNTLQHLLLDQDLLQAFVAARDLLEADGVYAFDIYQPNVPYMSVSQENRLARSIDAGNGRHLEIREDMAYDAETCVLKLNWRLVDRDRPSDPPLAKTSYRLRQYFSADLERLLDAAGLVVRERFGDFDRSPFDAASKKQILVCGRR